MRIKIDVPDITGYSDGFVRFWIKGFPLGSPPFSADREINALATTYVRLVQDSLDAYRSAKRELSSFWMESTRIHLGAMHRAVSHLETCISNMHRAGRCFNRLRRRPQLNTALAQALRRPKPTFGGDAVANRLSNVRNAVHHFEEELVDHGGFQEGAWLALVPTGPETPVDGEEGQTLKIIDRLAIGAHEILFSELSVWLEEMARVAQVLADFKGSAST